ncbi:unnamed protein product [Polarella glacialis]|uniref:Uncharacterized protein n=1 Tax=Polarella glacialis TaxID=89957 RepID=A0A813DA68_POLGL|nr:unnamed protein product [Polarella glacialis]
MCLVEWRSLRHTPTPISTPDRSDIASTTTTSTAATTAITRTTATAPPEHWVLGGRTSVADGQLAALTRHIESMSRCSQTDRVAVSESIEMLEVEVYRVAAMQFQLS